MDLITQKFKQYFSQTFTEFGATPKGVGWNGEESSRIRYDKMLEVIRPTVSSENDPVSFLDVGCGYGGLYWYVKEIQPLELYYTGIDIEENMIEYAISKASNAKFICQDIFSWSSTDCFDYVVCNGILTQKFSATPMEMDNFTHKLIRKIFELCKIGVAFNVMSTKVDFMIDDLYYRNPVELFAFCLAEITTKIKIDHAYPLYEYTVYLYKD